MPNKITKNEFVSWKNDRITKGIIEALTNLKTMIESEMLNDSVIRDPEGHGRLRELSGYRQGLNEILLLSVEDFEEEEIDEQTS